MSKYQFNVNNFSIEKDERFFAYINTIDANRIVKMLNKQEEEIQELKQRNNRQFERLNEITNLMFKRDWKTLENMVDEWEKEEEQLEREWGTYGGIND